MLEIDLGYNEFEKFEEFLKNIDKEKFECEEIITEEKFEKAKERKKELNNFVTWLSQRKKEKSFQDKHDLTPILKEIKKEEVKYWFIEYIGIMPLFHNMYFLPIENTKDEKFKSYALSECTSEVEIQNYKKGSSCYCLFFGIFSDYTYESNFKKEEISIEKFKFIYYKGEILIKRRVFSDKNNIKRMYNISKYLNLRGFLFSFISLNDFLMTFYGIALKRYRHIEHMDFEKMKNFLRCSKCHATTKLDLENFINSSLNTVEAHYKCPKCGEVYSFSKLKKIYEENMRNAY